MSRERKNNRRKALNRRIVWWMSICGTLLAVSGTILVNTSSYRPLELITAVLTRIDDRDNAWSELMDYEPFADTLGEQTSISSETQGFDCLVDLLARRGRITDPKDVVKLVVEGQMLYGGDNQKIGRFVVRAQHAGEEKSRVVAWVEDISSWIEAEKLNWSISTGFPVLSLGLLLSLSAVLVSRKPDSGEVYRTRRSSMLTPVLVSLGGVGIVLFAVFARRASVLADLSSLAVVLTLLVLVRYAYDTFRIAQITSIPSASLGFVQLTPRDGNPLVLRSLPENHSRIPLELWCEMRLTILGKHVELDRFYGGKIPWYLQPYQKPVGVLDLSRILEAEGRQEEELQQAWDVATDDDEKHRVLRLDVRFWYRTLDGRFASPPFSDCYYYNPAKRSLVLDPHAPQEGK